MGLKQNFAMYSEPNKESATLFQALSTVLTGSYVKIGSEMTVEGATTVFLHLYWTKGDETSIEIKAEYSLVSDGTTSQPSTVTTSAAESTIQVESFKFSTATDNIVVPFGVQGRFINLYIKATGGTPTGTYGAGIFFVRE